MTDKFSQVVSDYGHKLMSEFGLSDVQSCGCWGNFGHESSGFRAFQQVGSGANGGGRGWAQWTGPRRVSFIAWCKAHGLDPRSDAANYGYFCFELHGHYANVVTALRRCTTLASAVSTFERLYEAAGIKAMGSREAWGRRALAILSPGHPAAAEPARKARKPRAAGLGKKARARRAASHHHHQHG